MENTETGSFLRNRRLESFLDKNSGPNVKKTLKISSKEVARQRPTTDAFVDDDGWISTLISCVRLVTCFLTMMVTTTIWTIIILLLLPWPSQRIRQGNICGHVTGRLMMWILGNPIKIEGKEFSNERAIYISNHASLIDVFLVIWLTPTGTVGIAKKEIIWYPLFGQLYVLAKHLRIDRSNPSAAIQSMKEAVQAVIKHNLSLIIFPEGTRSKNGRLLPFKKGFVHLALQSGLPIVPMVLTGTHRAWRKGSLHVRPAPISVKYLPPIRTDNWTDDRVDDYIKMVHDIYVENLPELQKPVVSEDTKNSSRS
ncbi:1-acyl-sn-glycerol-3-phosphate acyltransferase-like isoform X2 [Durio zibethinus]|uniref:1-acyl-sn-glycerol-3-phosphate acyltransferase n=1 Tax=Durio zibethinus TaxID=66656 RepID=A0A6P5WPI3_DURZI|nr:1-acyl-sn-glycerol-3-phosphate acyltransferase-like isoform X2 [Durio zibethinus]